MSKRSVPTSESDIGRWARKSYLLVSLVLAGVLIATSAIGEESFSPYVDATGQITLPADFRTNMVHLGSWFVPEGDASGFHDVYTEARSVEAYRKTGKFPDGATLVKELRGAKSGDYTTGKDVSSAVDEVKQWFVMIKDAEGRFPDNPIWGNGWGWALYKPDDSTKNVATDFTQDCLTCHIPARNTDWVYVEAYPTLR
ncbi:MAG: cytochrome P460 family protein [Gammaproteobacteria bacterium]